uniref:Uncharacterized protein n=1 Tax=Megaselia scalaris TaxID=36166 RepID=T1GVY1_MEGSC
MKCRKRWSQIANNNLDNCILIKFSHKNKELMNDILTNHKLKNGYGQMVSQQAPVSPTKRPLSPDHPNPSVPIVE